MRSFKRQSECDVIAARMQPSDVAFAENEFIRRVSAIALRDDEAVNEHDLTHVFLTHETVLRCGPSLYFDNVNRHVVGRSLAQRQPTERNGNNNGEGEQETLP